MAIRFDKLFTLLKSKGLSVTDLEPVLMHSSIYRLRDESHNATEDVIDRLCYLLDCQPGDIMEYAPLKVDLPEGDISAKEQIAIRKEALNSYYGELQTLIQLIDHYVTAGSAVPIDTIRGLVGFVEDFNAKYGDILDTDSVLSKKELNNSKFAKRLMSHPYYPINIVLYHAFKSAKRLLPSLYESRKPLDVVISWKEPEIELRSYEPLLLEHEELFWRF